MNTRSYACSFVWSDLWWKANSESLQRWVGVMYVQLVWWLSVRITSGRGEHTQIRRSVESLIKWLFPKKWMASKESTGDNAVPVASNSRNLYHPKPESMGNSSSQIQKDSLVEGDPWWKLQPLIEESTQLMKTPQGGCKGINTWPLSLPPFSSY